MLMVLQMARDIVQGNHLADFWAEPYRVKIHSG